MADMACMIFIQYLSYSTQAVTHQDIHMHQDFHTPWNTPLHVALTNPETSCEVVHALLKACPSVASIANKDGLYPLHKACQHCPDEKVIEVLLEEYSYALQNLVLHSVANLLLGQGLLLEQRRRRTMFFLKETIIFRAVWLTCIFFQGVQDCNRDAYA